MSVTSRTLSALALSAATLGSAQAADLPVIGIMSSSTFETYRVINLVNGRGLTGDQHSGDYLGKWMNNGGDTATLVFEFDGLKQLAGTTIWNYGGGCCGESRSVKDLVINLSTDGKTFTEFTRVSLGMPTTDSFGGETFSLGDSTARFVRFDILSNHGGDFAGLSEVKFNGVSAVPEASSLAYGLVGLVVAGFWQRRRNSAA